MFLHKIKYFFALSILFALIISCEKDEGGGGDPELSQETVVFDSKPDSIDLYSKKDIWTIGDNYLREENQKIEGEWFSVEKVNYYHIKVKVKENNSKKSRIVQIPYNRANYFGDLTIIQN